MSVSTIVRLSEHDNIVGVKDSVGDVAKLAQIVLATGDNHFQVT